MEVRIGIVHHNRELVVESDESAEAVEKQVADSVSSGGVLTLTDTKGRTVAVPAARIAFVELGARTPGQVGFRS